MNKKIVWIIVFCMVLAGACFYSYQKWKKVRPPHIERTETFNPLLPTLPRKR